MPVTKIIVIQLIRTSTVLMRIVTAVLLCLLSIKVNAGHASRLPEELTTHPFSLGIMTGYGSTTWGNLVGKHDPEATQFTIDALNDVMPIEANEGGAAWGMFLGYEFSPFFGLEGSYIQYPKATVRFKSGGAFSARHGGLNHFSTKTSTLSLLGRVLINIPNTKVRIYSGTGVASLKRKDVLRDDSIITPNFVLGANYRIEPQVLAEIGAYFTVGHAEVTNESVNEFIPFLYSLMLKVAYLV